MPMNETGKFQDRLLGVYCCGHVFRRQCRVLLVGRQDGDWQFLCGETDHSDPGEPYHVSVGALIDIDPTLDGIADLPAEWEAERLDVDSPWIRTRCGARDA